ncbi:MAG: gephyrin-like molybdotransferase Glp [Gammaproteobacteria bacterium]|nr:gephyrin-like molybdotransferase Glp [Gammaproteobacteria bacterium]
MPDCDCDRPQADMLSVESARERLLAGARVVGDIQGVPLVEGHGRVLAEALVSAVDVPPHDNSAMDGYAVHSADLGAEAEVRQPVVQTISAGAVGAALAAGCAARIFTGAPIPPGADAVVMQERCRVDGDGVIIRGPVRAGAHIRRAAEDIAVGQTILAPGRRLRAQELGLAASVGCGTLPVYRRPRVAMFFTGDELVEPGTTPRPGQIYDSNRYTLAGLLDGLGCEVVDLGVVADTLEATRATLQAAALEADMVVSTGGVSVGEKDYVRLALTELGKLDLWRIRVKPGKPLAFGRVGETPFIGLPGNPVSMFATFCLFVAPFLKRMSGIEQVLSRPQRVAAGFEWPQAGGRREFLRARLAHGENGAVEAEIHPHQGSGVLTSTVWADGFVEVPEGTVVKHGDRVDYHPFEGLL